MISVLARVAAAVWMNPAFGGVQVPPRPTAITGGAPVGVCGWPTAVWLDGCSGTLVDPEHVVLAYHCGRPGAAFLGEDVADPMGRWIDIEACWRYPGGGPGTGRDIALCRLATPQLDVPIVPPLMGCEVDALQPGAEVTIVGSGRTPDDTFGVKYAVTTTIVELSDNDEARIGGDGKDGCVGDSGGPVFIELPDGEGWRVFGISSYGDPECVDGGMYSMMHTGMPWLEQTAQRDLTPCHDAEGNWDPDGRCQRFPLAPFEGQGSWLEGCAAEPRSALSQTCGPALQPASDDDPPTVVIVDPEPDTMVQSDPATDTAVVVVDVDAVDDGWGVARVELLVDGARIDDVTDHVTPWSFEVDLAPGVHELSARAIDHADHSTLSEPIRLGVDEDPAPDSPGCACRSNATAPSSLLLLLLLLTPRNRSHR